MFKLHRHKSDRSGERIEFRLSSFQAFQIPKGWDRLVLNMISVDTGKTMAKANKAIVRSGTCQWTETFSEGIWIPIDGTSKEIEDCNIKLAVTMGSHRSGLLGDVTLNLKDYLSSRDSGSFSLPLKNCNYGTILQVRIQCLNPKRGFRDVKSSKEKTFQETHQINANDVGTKSEGPAYRDGHAHRETSFSASGSHRTSDSENSSIASLNFSPKNNINVGRQDSGNSHISTTSSAGPTEDCSKSNPSSFNSRASGSTTPNRWQESSVQNSPHALAPKFSRPSSSKEYLEAAEETIEELQDEAKMWERHAQKLKLDVEKFKKESSQKSKRQAELDSELSNALAECDSLKREIKQLKSSLEEATTRQNSARASKNDVMLHVQKELEDEVRFLKESNNSLSMQLKKSQEANIELVAILEELEDTIEKQKVEIACFQEQSPVSEHDNDTLSQKLIDLEAEWKFKISEKEKEIKLLTEKASSSPNEQNCSENGSSNNYAELMKEIEELRDKVLELETDCAELTDENLELIYKLKESGKGIKQRDAYDNSDFEVDNLKSRITKLEEELRVNQMMNGGNIEVKNLEKKCTDLEVELQYFKEQNSSLDTKLRESKLEVEERISELTELQKSLDSVSESSLKDKEIDDLRQSKEELEVLLQNVNEDKVKLEENLASVLDESSITAKCLEDVQHEMQLLSRNVDSYASTNTLLEKKCKVLENSKYELEMQIAELEEQLSEFANENESTKLELEDLKTLVEDLKDEVAKQQVEIESQNEEAQNKLSEAQEEMDTLQKSHSKLQLTVENLYAENSSLQKSNGDLRKKKLELHERNAYLETELSDMQKKYSELLRKVEILGSELSSTQNDIVSKENILSSQLESILHENENQEEKVRLVKHMLTQMDADKTVEVEKLEREIAHLSSQLCSTQDERQKMASDAVLEVSNLRSDKIKLQNNLEEATSKIKLYEKELHALKQESAKKVQGLVESLNASKQSEQTLMSDVDQIQRQFDIAKLGEEKFKKVASELDLKLKASEYEKEQTIEEIASLKLQLQKLTQLEDEVIEITSLLQEAKREKGKLEELLKSVSKECEGLKTERTQLLEKISVMQKALDDFEGEGKIRVALEEKIGILEALKKENEQKNEKDNSDIQAKVDDLEAKIHTLENELAESLEANSAYKIQLQRLLEEKQNSNSEDLTTSTKDENMGSEQATKIASLETELKEMQERYLNMSLQYAEVEAQREELVMKLKTTTKGKGWFA